MTDQKRYWITEQGMKEAAARAEYLLRECMACAVRMAFARHNLELDPDAATEEEIAYDAAGACFGEECCDDKPIPELTELLSIAVHSEAASPPPMTEAEARKWCDDHRKHPVIGKAIQGAQSWQPDGLATIIAYVFSLAAPPQGTPAPEPDSCPTCGSGNRKWPLAVWPVHDSFPELCADPWHSTVAAQTDPFSKGYTNRHSESVSDACGRGEHSECTQTFKECYCTVRGGHKTMHAYVNQPVAAQKEKP